jgi:hemolysin III
MTFEGMGMTEAVKSGAGPIDLVSSKPKYRGIPDLIATLVAIPAMMILVVNAQEGVHTQAALIYGASAVFLFAMSSLYHVPMWPRRTRQLFRAADHSAVYVLIAGSYTPVAMILVPGAWAKGILIFLWLSCVFGLAKSVLWPKCPRFVNAAIYVVLGWSIATLVPDIYAIQGVGFCALLGGAGLIYTLGAVIYTRRWCNFNPAVFGYHESFHLLVVGASACIYAGMWGLLV